MRRKGFTLVELAIVLVIIGIILGGILKGKSLMDSARVKRLERDLKSLEAVVWTYYDRYGRFPGDNDTNGFMDPSVHNNPITYNDISTMDLPWNELKQADLLPHDIPNSKLTRTSWNGQFQLGYAEEEGTSTAYNGIGIIEIPCFAAKAIDASIDGEVDAKAGAVRLMKGYALFAASNGTDDYNCPKPTTPVSIVYLFNKHP